MVRSHTIDRSTRLRRRLSMKLMSKKESRGSAAFQWERIGRDALKGVLYLAVLFCDDSNFGSHPWMNAALIVFDAFVVLYFARGLTGLQDRTARLSLRALGDLGQAEDVVEGLEEAAAKLLHFGERMHLAAVIERGEDVTHVQG